MVTSTAFGRKINMAKLLLLIFIVIVGLNSSSVVCGNETRDFFVKKLFSKYGNDESITVKDFIHLLSTLSVKHGHLDKPVIKQLDFAIPEEKSNGKSDESQLPITRSTNHDHDHDHDHGHDNHGHESKKSANKLENALINGNSTLDNYTTTKECMSTNDILNVFAINATINNQQFINLCPAIIYKLSSVPCDENKISGILQLTEVASSMVWLYAAVAVLVISLSGLVVVAIIPVLRGAYYQGLLQFLVALAVGSLIGDALLHLLPHAMSGHDHRECETDGHDGHTHEHEVPHSSHCEEENHHLDMMVWKGLIAVMGVLIFFMAERLLTVCSTRRRGKFKASSKKIVENGNHESIEGDEKMCKQKYNGYSYCYGEVTVDMLKGLNEPVCDEPDHHNCLEKSSQTDEAKDSMRQPPEEMKSLNPARPKIGDGDHFDDVEATSDVGVIVTQHEHRRHGHSHTHTHSVPSSVSSVACMVIMGDGLHNFSDGLAIGAAFANSITGGVSTAIAVFCHELPHELGDFAILLKSGMTAKQALAYNGLSSVLCFLGMVVGVGLGNLAAISPWIFAGAAGMFIYIALVDMIPELNSATNPDYFQLFLQFLGMFVGIMIMLLIALHEHDLQKIFHYN